MKRVNEKQYNYAPLLAPRGYDAPRFAAGFVKHRAKFAGFGTG